MQARFADLGQDIPPRNERTPGALGAFQKGEIGKWWPLIKAVVPKPTTVRPGAAVAR